MAESSARSTATRRIRRLSCRLQPRRRARERQAATVRVGGDAWPRDGHSHHPVPGRSRHRSSAGHDIRPWSEGHRSRIVDHCTAPGGASALCPLESNRCLVRCVTLPSGHSASPVQRSMLMSRMARPRSSAAPCASAGQRCGRPRSAGRPRASAEPELAGSPRVSALRRASRSAADGPIPTPRSRPPSRAGIRAHPFPRATSASRTDRS